MLRYWSLIRGVIFVISIEAQSECAGHSSGSVIATPNEPDQSKSKFVITTSTDRRDEFRLIHDFAWRARDSRLAREPFASRQEDIGLIRDLSQRLLNDLSKTKEKKQRIVSEVSSWFSHDGILAVPLGCLDFTPSPRCLRCQALFRYNVPNYVNEEEMKYQNGNPNLTCAEAYAHFYCRENFNTGKVERLKGLKKIWHKAKHH
jgi:hypothetical protein